MDDYACDVLILGIGNLLWADEGFGVRCTEALARDYQLPAGVRIMDGGTQGLYLLPYVQGAQRLIVFDAVDYGLPAGTLKRVENDEVPAFMGAKKMSLHQTGFQEVIAAARLTGAAPAEMLLIGVQPVELEDFGGSLRPAVKAQIPAALDIALEQLAAWGYGAQRRTQPDGDAAGAVNVDALAVERYENERPSAEAACRIGDARVLSGLGS